MFLTLSMNQTALTILLPFAGVVVGAFFTIHPTGEKGTGHAETGH